MMETVQKQLARAPASVFTMPRKRTQTKRALRRAIEIMTEWDKRVPGSYDGALPDDIVILSSLLADMDQLALPIEK